MKWDISHFVPVFGSWTPGLESITPSHKFAKPVRGGATGWSLWSVDHPAVQPRFIGISKN